MSEGSDLIEGKEVRLGLFYQVSNVLSFIGVVIINILSSFGALGQTNPEVSDKYMTRFTPAGFTFAVWGVIYFFCAVFVIYQALPRNRNSRVLFVSIGPFFIISCILNIIWSIVFAQEWIWASAPILTLIFLSLLAPYLRIGIGRSRTAVSPADFFCIHVTFSIYLAWVTLATIVNWSVALSGPGEWDGSPWTASGWSILLMGIVVVLTILTLATRKDGAFGLVVAWGLFGIGSQQGELGFNDVKVAAFVFAPIVLVLSLLSLAWKFFLWRKQRAE
eukprot:CAMPEP_0197011522 /NCGR_PEP_ID=MMETSP1380-20130617/58831_1 /TAXON_ID=5936 /ORGANISM="Euplotes crassus, Strain CT5" /LENGTH=275 /DNA_ID=CAMNT_0042434287 /DNA_START=10 /DNA_END=837 /DNA_ORIENTATION=+